MSLLRLLTTGKSFVGLKSEPHRYRVPRGRVLPKFDARANPFMAVVRPELPVQPAAPGPANAETPPARVEEVPAKLTPDSKIRTRRSLFSLGWGRSRTSEVVRAAKGSSLVQGELSLEKVTVVRNDLSDSDLELIPGRKPDAARLPAPQTVSVPAEQNPRPIESAWGRVSARFFSAAK